MGFNSWKHSSFMSSRINFSMDCLGKEYRGCSHCFPFRETLVQNDPGTWPSLLNSDCFVISQYQIMSWTVLQLGTVREDIISFSFFLYLFLSFFFYVIFVLFWGGDIWGKYFNNPVNLIQLLQLSNAEISKPFVKSQIVNISSFAGHMVPISTTFLTSVVTWKQL